MPEDGADLVLTIDADYQAIAEEELATTVAEFQAQSGIAIVANPSSGEILAMANVPLYDPNAFVRYDAEVRRNRAVTDLYEPGSTFKAFTFAAALAEKLVQPEDLVFCEDGLMPISGGFVRDVHPSGWLTVRGVLEESSNIGTIKVARKLGPARLYRYIRMFGFGNETGATVSGEVAGDVKHPSEWSSRSLESICIGQEVGVTALQMVAAYGAVANGGRLMVPRILLKAVREDSALQVESPETVRQVVSAEVAGTVVSFLEGVVAHGTGTNAQVKGYRTAGKTGTAQRVSEGGTGYDPDLYVSSFIGFLPVERPELLGLVIVDSPQGTHYGSQVAAPVFSRMMQRVLSLRETPLRHRARPAGGDGAGAKAAEVVRSSKDASSAPVGRGFRDEAVDPDPDVVRTSLATGSDGSGRIGAPLQMPDVVGISLRQAVSRLTSSGLQVRMRGSGMVVDQRPRPGTVVARGSVCRVICRTAG